MKIIMINEDNNDLTLLTIIERYDIYPLPPPSLTHPPSFITFPSSPSSTFSSFTAPPTLDMQGGYQPFHIFYVLSHQPYPSVLLFL